MAAGSVDSANDFLTLNGLAPEPFRQAGNERPLTEPTPAVEQFGASSA